MASVHGGMFHAVPVATQVTPVARPDAGPLGLSSVTPQGAGAPQDQAQFAGNLPAGSDQVVATQSQDGGGNTIVHLEDGSTITFVGTAHIDAIIH